MISNINRHLVPIDYASPQKALNTEFIYSDPVQNKRFYNKHITKKSRLTIYDNNEVKLFRTGDEQNGYFIVGDLLEKRVIFVCKYYGINTNWLKKTVVITELWKEKANYNVKDVPLLVAEYILLKMYPSMLSDTLHTQHGEDFWKRLIYQTWNTKYYHGLIDFKKKIVYKTQENEEKEAFYERISNKAYLDNARGKLFRYIISVNPLPDNRNYLSMLKPTNK